MRLLSLWCAAATVLGAIAPRAAAAQTGSVNGIVVADENGQALGYSVVAVPARNLERFTDDSGRFVLRDLPPGAVTLRVRHIGYAPQEVSVVVRDGESAEVRVTLAHVAVTLAAVRVSQRAACTNPGAPTAATDSALATIFGQLEQNAEQYRLISTHYPFTSITERQFGYDPAPPATVFRPDTVPIESNGAWAYRPGEVVTRDPSSFSGSYAVRIPTLAVFADRAFLDAHCFWSAGVVQEHSEKLLRIDFEAAERIRSPDLDGSMYLDPSSFVIRRSVIRLSRFSREIADFDSVSVETQFAEVLPGVPIIAGTEGRSHFAEPRQIRGQSEAANLEHQRIVALRFAKGVPGSQTGAPKSGRARGPTVIWLARVLGVFDAETGAPVPGVVVRDLMSGLSAVTSATGTLRLSFLPRSSGLLTIRKAGYEWDTLGVRLSLADTTPITFLLRPSQPTRTDSSGTAATERPPEQHKLNPTDSLAVIRVRVATAAGAPVGDASVFVREDGVGAVIVGRTDGSGRYAVAAPLEDAGAHYTVAVRKIGYAPATSPVNPRPGDTIAVSLVLAATPELDTVRVTASQLASRNYVIDGAEITSSTRGIFDALDALAKLRPQMVGDGGRGCPTVKNIWVNGVRVWWQVPRPDDHPAPMVVLVPRLLVDFGFQSVLQRIKPEHIAEMRYANCWDTSQAEIGTDNALYITLKPGIAWDWKRGSHPAPPAP